VDFAAMYQSGLSIPDIARNAGVPRSAVRTRLLRMGVHLRTRAEGVRLAGPKIGHSLRGKTRVFTTSHKEAIRSARLRWGEEHAAGISLKPSGYLEFTRGPHKGKSVHVVAMEERLGRPLRDDEHVHHIDGDKINNSDNNLALVTRSGHMRWHRYADSLAGKFTERTKNGRFS